MSTRRRQQALVAVVGVLAVLVGAVGTRLLDSDSAPRRPPAGPRPTGREAAPRSDAAPKPRFFSAHSFWNVPLARSAARDADSDRLLSAFNRHIAQEQQEGIGPWIATTETSTPVYVVSRDQRRVPVELRTGPWGETLRNALAKGVPIPADAQPAAGPDRHMTVYQPATDTLWEFWHTLEQNGRWSAEWGGVMRNTSSSPGYFTDRAFPGSGYNWGATASSLPVVGGTMTIDELRRGRIDHALALNVPDARKGVFSWPAQRTDGNGGAGALPEGARLRVDPSLDVRSLGLSPTGAAMALAAQRYGIVVRDVTHHATGFSAEDPGLGAADPYAGPNGLFRGTPADALRGFPWRHLQLLKMSLCTRAPCPDRGTGPS